MPTRGDFLADDEIDELVRHDDRLPDLDAVEMRPHPRATPSRARPARPPTGPPRPRTGRAPCRSPARRARTSRARAATRPRPATAAPRAARVPARPTAPRRCAARTAGSATRPSPRRTARAGAVGSSDSAFTSSITAEIGVWNWNRRSMSSVTFAIVSCALRPSGPSRRAAGGALSATSCTTRHSRRRKRTIPSTPGLGPLHVLVGRAEEEDVEPHGIGAVLRRRDRRDRSRSPCVFDIFVPPSCTQPWWNRRANGSRKPSIPKSFIALTKKRE